MKFEKPNAKQEEWREMVRSGGSILSKYKPVQIHHVIGRTAKLKDTGNIGHWFILPLCNEEHLWVDWGVEGLRLMKERYTFGHGDGIKTFKMIPLVDMNMLEFQKFLFSRVVERWLSDICIEKYFDQSLYDSIQRWHR